MSLGLLSDLGRSVLLHAQSSANSINVQAVLVLLLLLDLVSIRSGVDSAVGPYGTVSSGLAPAIFVSGPDLSQYMLCVDKLS
jgi:hypothetical protein